MIQEFVLAAGYVGLFVLIFAESGILLGIFFPGDSVLFTAGFLASQGIFQVGALICVCVVAAILGDSVGYSFGHRVGRRFFNKPDSLFFNHTNVERAQTFYERHGGKTIILARFLPGIRTLAPIIAGVGGMRYKSFLSYNVVGGLLWGAGLTGLGYVLGSSIPGIDKYLIPVVLGIIVLSSLPSLWSMFHKKEQRQRFYAGARQAWQRFRGR